MANQYNRFKDFIINVLDTEHELAEQDIEITVQENLDFEFSNEE